MKPNQLLSTGARHNPVNAFTLGGIARDAGLTVEQFLGLLYANGAAHPRVEPTRASGATVSEPEAQRDQLGLPLAWS